MEPTVKSNDCGFTLVEFLVAIVILMVGMLGLLQTVNYAINHNMTNQLRQEALVLADEWMNREKVKAFDRISSPSTFTPNLTPPYLRSIPLNQRLVNGAFRNYSVTMTTNDTSPQSKNIDIQVTWNYKGQRFVHSISSLVTKYQ